MSNTATTSLADGRRQYQVLKKKNTGHAHTGPRPPRLSHAQAQGHRRPQTNCDCSHCAEDPPHPRHHGWPAVQGCCRRRIARAREAPPPLREDARHPDGTWSKEAAESAATLIARAKTSMETSRTQPWAFRTARRRASVWPCHAKARAAVPTPRRTLCPPIRELGASPNSVVAD